jgi:hypothetical protein
MTRAEAERFIEEAERLPVDQVDVEKLTEAVKVLGKSGVNVKPILDLLTAMGGDLSTLGGQLSDAGSRVGSALQGLVDWLSKSNYPSEKGLRPSEDDQEWDVSFAERAAKLVLQVTAPDTVQEDRAITGPGRQGPPPTRVPGPRGSADPAVRRATAGPPGPRIPSDLLNRLDQAAERAGVSAEDVQSIIEDAQQAASGGQPVTMPDGSVVQLPPDPDAPSVEELLEQQISDWTQGAIGVPEGFTAVRDEEIPAGEGLEKFRQARGLGTPTRSTEVVPRYFVGDEWQRAGMPPERILELQRQLEQAGQLSDGDFYAGVWDQATAGAMQAVMGMANASGQTWEDQLKDLIANVPESVKEARNAAKLAKQFQAPAFVKLDPATAAQRVKRMLRSELNREPTDEEMAALTGEMSGLYRAEYEANVAAMRAEFDAQEQGLETGVAVAPGAVQGVDPVARFGEAFDRRFAPEMDFIEGQEDQIRNATNVFASLRNMSGLIG